MPDPILDTIARLRHRPAMYIGSHSAEALFQFLVGYGSALEDYTELDLTRYGEFIKSLYAKYGYGRGGDSWAWVLGQAAGGDAAALDLFFAELDAFQQQFDRSDAASSHDC